MNQYKKDKRGGTNAPKEDAKKVFMLNASGDARVPRGLKLRHHLRLGEMKLELVEDTLRVSNRKVDFIPCSDANGVMLVRDAVKQLVGNKVLLNACVRDFLMENPTLIPKSMKGKSIYFLGTTFESAPQGDPYFPFIYEHCGWSWHDIEVGPQDVFGKNAYIAVLS